MSTDLISFDPILLDRVFTIIKKDDLDEFKQLDSQYQISTKIFPNSDTLPLDIRFDKPPVIKVAAYYGAKEIFFYLTDTTQWEEICRLSNTFQSKPIIYYAIIGQDNDIVQYLLEKVDSNSDIRYMFLAALQIGEVNLAQFLINQQINTNPQYVIGDLISALMPNGLYCFQVAAKSEQLEIIQLLYDYFIESGISPENFFTYPNNEGNALLTASKKGNIELFNFIFEKAPSLVLSLSPKKGATVFIRIIQYFPLDAAINFYNEQILSFDDDARLFLLNTPNKEKKTPLHYATEKNYFELVSLLLQNPEVDIMQKDCKQLYPIYYACKLQNIDMLNIYYDNENVKEKICDMRRRRGQTILHYIAKHNWCDGFKLTLEKIPELLNIVDDSGIYPIIRAAIESNNSIIEYFCSLQEPDYIREYFEQHYVDGSYKTILHYAIIEENYKLTRFLVDNNYCDLNFVPKPIRDISVHNGRGKEAYKTPLKQLELAYSTPMRYLYQQYKK